MKYFIVIILMLIFCKDGKSQSKETELWGIDDLMDYINVDRDNTKLTIINFWATWCAPCIREMPYFDEVGTSNQNTVEVLFVSLDFGEDLERKVRPFLERKDIRSRVVLLNDQKYNEWMGKVDQRWTGAIPATMFITTAGKKVFYEKEFEKIELLDIVEKLRTE